MWVSFTEQRGSSLFTGMFLDYSAISTLCRLVSSRVRFRYLLISLHTNTLYIGAEIVTGLPMYPQIKWI